MIKLFQWLYYSMIEADYRITRGSFNLIVFIDLSKTRICAFNIDIHYRHHGLQMWIDRDVCLQMFWPIRGGYRVFFLDDRFRCGSIVYKRTEVDEEIMAWAINSIDY